MSWISRLKDPKYYIDFDSGYIFDEAGNIVAEITSSTQINILLYLADHPEKWLKKDGIIRNCWPDNADAEYVSDSTFYKTIFDTKHIHSKVEESIESKRNLGYKYHGHRKENKDDVLKSTGNAGNKEEITNNRQEYIGGAQKPHEDNANIINLAALVIHKNSEDRPPIDDDLRYEISEIIKLLEQGLSEDFEEICEQAWAELSLMQKALKIFKAYENLTDRSPTLSPTDTNTRL